MKPWVWFLTAPFLIASVAILVTSARLSLRGRKATGWDKADLYMQSAGRNLAASGLMIVAVIIIRLGRLT